MSAVSTGQPQPSAPTRRNLGSGSRESAQRTPPTGQPRRVSLLIQEKKPGAPRPAKSIPVDRCKRTQGRRRPPTDLGARPTHHVRAKTARTRRASGPTPDSPQDQRAGACAKGERAFPNTGPGSVASVASGVPARRDRRFATAKPRRLPFLRLAAIGAEVRQSIASPFYAPLVLAQVATQFLRHADLPRRADTRTATPTSQRPRASPEVRPCPCRYSIGGDVVAGSCDIPGHWPRTVLRRSTGHTVSSSKPWGRSGTGTGFIGEVAPLVVPSGARSSRR